MARQKPMAVMRSGRCDAHDRAVLGAEGEALLLEPVIERRTLSQSCVRSSGLAFTTRSAWRIEATIAGGSEAVNM